MLTFFTGVLAVFSSPAMGLGEFVGGEELVAPNSRMGAEATRLRTATRLGTARTCTTCHSTIASTLDFVFFPEFTFDDATDRGCHWKRTRDAAIRGHNRFRLSDVGVEYCMDLCTSIDWCASFDYHNFENKCDLSDVQAPVQKSDNGFDHFTCERPETKWDKLLITIKTFNWLQLEAFKDRIDEEIQPLVELHDWMGDELITPLQQRDWAEVAEAMNDPVGKDLEWGNLGVDPTDFENWDTDEIERISAKYKWLGDEFLKPIAERDWEKMVDTFNEDPYNIWDEESDESSQLGRGVESPRLGWNSKGHGN